MFLKQRRHYKLQRKRRHIRFRRHINFKRPLFFNVPHTPRFPYSMKEQAQNYLSWGDIKRLPLAKVRGRRLVKQYTNPHSFEYFLTHPTLKRPIAHKATKRRLVYPKYRDMVHTHTFIFGIYPSKYDRRNYWRESMFGGEWY